MLFNSYIFIFIFLPMCFIGYFTLNYFKRYTLAQFFLLAMSLWFYAYFNINYLGIILVSIIFNYIIYLMFEKIQAKWARKTLLITGGIANIGILIYFKYMDFFISNVNSIFNTNYAFLNIVLPLGISFFTFQQLSFVIDAYNREVPKYNIIHYASFVTFFPQLIAGPIVTHDELVPQFLDKRKKNINWDNLAKGIYIFVLGLAKKVLIADTFGNVANFGFSNVEALNTTSAIIIVLSYTIQIYFDFSGYSDMAIGIGKMFNIDLPLNFNSPYKALTINDFWDRWHMTLTRFFTRYIYIPLGGSRKGKYRTYLNVLIVFLVSGFWHGANWTFVLWGIMHGIFSIITRHFKKFFEKLHPALNWIITFGFINITWVLFRANSIGQALKILNRIAIFDFQPISQDILNCFRLTEFSWLVEKLNIESYFPYFILQMFVITAIILILGSKNAYEKMKEFKPSLKNAIFTVCLLIWCIFSFSGVSTFLYFNF